MLCLFFLHMLIPLLSKPFQYGTYWDVVSIQMHTDRFHRQKNMVFMDALDWNQVMFVKDFFKCNGNNYEIEKFPLWNGATFMLTTFRA